MDGHAPPPSPPQPRPARPAQAVTPPARPATRPPAPIRPPSLPPVRAETAAPSPPSPPQQAPAVPRQARPWWPFLLLAVPVSSFFGLLRLMLAGDWDLFGRVWSAKLWADLAFAVGTAGAVWVSAYLVTVRGPATTASFAAAGAAAFVMHLVIYLLSWPLTGLGDADGTTPSFLAIAFDTSGGSILELVVRGLPGLAAMTFYGPLLGLFAARQRVAPVD